MEASNQQSVHITDNGYIKVQYDSDGHVMEVTEEESAWIRMILEMQQKGITINFYDVLDDLMPESTL